jgi:hypothetical protein
MVIVVVITTSPRHCRRPSCPLSWRGAGGGGGGGGGGGHEVGVVVGEAARYRSTPVRCEAPIKVRF